MSPELHPINALIDRDDVLQQIKHEFETADPDYGQHRSALWDRLRPLAEQVDDLQEQGHSIDCSQQHRLETQWLLNYTADWSRAEATLEDLEASLANHDQPPLAQDSSGSWGPCCSELYRKLEPTVGELQDPHLGSGVILQPLAFMAKFQDMDWLVGDLQRLQVSDIRQTKRNNRDELGSLQSSLAQLFFKSAISSALNAHPELQFAVTPPMSDRLWAYFVDNQDADTGYWGPTYIFDGQPMRVQDLSSTFHIAHFRKGNVPNLARIVDTTLKIKDLRYPAGWRPDATRQYSDHNNYDLVTLLGYGWKQAPALQARITGEIQAMVDWCMTESLDGDRFRNPDGSPLDAFYDAVCFLRQIGFFYPNASRFWTTADPILVPAGTPTPYELCRKLRAGYQSMNPTGPDAVTVFSVLDDAIAQTTPSA
jgi:hypothetical protein